jgi:hypothetical protein
VAFVEPGHGEADVASLDGGRREHLNVIDGVGIVGGGVVGDQRGRGEARVVGCLEAKAEGEALAGEMVARHPEFRIELHGIDRVFGAEVDLEPMRLFGQGGVLGFVAGTGRPGHFAGIVGRGVDFPFGDIALYGNGAQQHAGHELASLDRHSARSIPESAKPINRRRRE